MNGYTAMEFQALLQQRVGDGGQEVHIGEPWCAAYENGPVYKTVCNGMVHKEGATYNYAGVDVPVEAVVEATIRTILMLGREATTIYLRQGLDVVYFPPKFTGCPETGYHYTPATLQVFTRVAFK